MKVLPPVSENKALEEALQRAFDDEVKAYETYSAVIEKFGAVFPFVNIIQAEQTHQEALLAVAAAHTVTLVRTVPETISIPDTLRECCELGVAAEIQNIQLYNELLLHVKDFAEVQDLFYRLQAASYNNHLPAFRNGVVSHASSHATAEANPMAALEGMMGQWGEFSHMAQKIAKGDVSQEEITKLLSTNFSFVAGALIGAVGASVLGGVIAPDEDQKSEDAKTEA
jgi:rubrerythrin